MAILSPTQLTSLRSKQHAIIPKLSVFKPVALLTALVNNGSIARGARAIAYDNGTGSGFSTIAAGQTLLVTTSVGQFKARIKSITGSQSSGTITVGENAIPWGDNQSFVVLHNYELWAIPPTIRDGVFYKDYDIAYGDQNSEPPPVVIMGGHRAKGLTAGSAVFDLDASGSYAVANGATIVSYAWGCVHNGGGTSGITIASASSAVTTLTITVEDGFWLSCTVTDSNGKSTTSYRVVFTDDPYENFVVDQFQGSWGANRWKVEIAAFGDVTLDDFPDNAIVVLWCVNYFNPGVSTIAEGYVNLWGIEDNVLFAGYIRRDTDEDEPGDATGKINFSLTSIDDLLNNLTDFATISLTATDPPATWYEYAPWLSVGRAIDAYLRDQTTAKQVCDILNLTHNVLKIQGVNFSEESALAKCNGLSYERGIFAKLLSDRLGRLHLVQDSQMLNAAARAALDIVYTIAAGDFTDSEVIPRLPEERVSAIMLDGFQFDGSVNTAVISIAPGYRENDISYGMPQFRGVGTRQIHSQVVSSQTNASEKCGRVLAVTNNPYQEFRQTFAGNWIGAFDIIPSIGWYEWGLSNSDLLRQLPLNGTLLLCRDIDIKISPTGVVTVDVYFESEALGPDGIEGNYPVGYPALPVTPPPWDPGGAAGPDRALLVFSDGASSFQGRAAAGKVNGFAMGAVDTYSTDNVFGFACGLTPAKGVIFFQNSTASKLQACTVNLDNVTITSFGTPADVVTAGYNIRDIVPLTDSLCVALYQHVVSGVTNAVVLSISGDTITVPGSPVALGWTGDPLYVSGARLDSTHIMVLGSGLAGPAIAGVLQISGSVITELGYDNASVNDAELGSSICTLDGTTAVVSYTDAGGTDLRAAVIWGIDVTLGTFFLGDDILLDDTHGAVAPYAANAKPASAGLDATHAIIAYQSNDSPNDIRAIAVLFDGSGGLSAGTGIVVSAGTNSRFYPAVRALSPARAIAGYGYLNDAASAHVVAARSLNISGTTITNNNDESALDSDVGGSPSILGMGLLETLT